MTRRHSAVKLVIVGGEAGGASCAAHLRRQDENAEILIVERGPYTLYANCRLPCHVLGIIGQESSLLVSKANTFLPQFAIDVRTGCEAIRISPDKKIVDLRNAATGEVKRSLRQARALPRSDPGAPAATRKFEMNKPASAIGRRRRAVMWCVMTAFVFAAEVAIADLGTRGGPEPADIDGISDLLRQDPYDLELLISFGTSTGGSAGHLALGIRDEGSGDDRVYSANFYADRARKHESGFYTEDLVIGVPKKEYLFKTVSSLGETAAFGLDFGEIYKRSVIGVRVYGVPADEKEALRAYFRRINDDFHHREKNTEYHDGEIKYDYMRLNCAKTIGSAFKFGAGYENLEVTSAKLLTRRRIVVAAKANIPTEMAIKLISEWNRRGYGLDVVLYKKYGGSTHVDPNEDEKVAFKDLPNRFPSVLSRDFRREAGAYEDFDNLFAMYLLYNMGKYSVRVNEQTNRLEIEKEKIPMAYPEAVELATRNARSDSRNFLLRLPFRPLGTLFGEAADNTHLYDFTSGGDKR